MLDRTIGFIDGVLGAIGKAVALLVLGMIALILLEMVSRGLFSTSWSWAHELSAWLLTAFVFLGGPYALIRGQFVRVDVFYARMGPRGRLVVDGLFSTTLFVLFAGVLLWLGGEFAWKSYLMGERSATGGWDGPVWAAKFMLPLGAALLCFGWLSHLLKLVRALRDGEEE